MGSGVETLFERYAETMIQALGHADRAVPALLTMQSPLQNSKWARVIVSTSVR